MTRQHARLFKYCTAHLVMAIVILLMTVGSCGAEGKETGTLRNFKRGDKLPTIKHVLVTGEQVQPFSPGRSGKPSLIMFFSIKPDFRKKRSLAMLSSLAGLADQYRTKLEVVGVYSDKDKAETVKAFMENSSINLKVYNDNTKESYNKYGVFMMPLVILTDADGKLHEVIPYTYNIREIVEGNVKLLLGEWTGEQLAASLRPANKEVKSEEEKEFIRRINYGRIMQSKKMYSQAIREFSTAAKLMPKKIEAHIELGYAYIATEDYEQSEHSFQAALTIDPESDDAIAGKGLAFYGKGDLDSALQELENAFIAPDPRLEVIIALAEIYEKKGNNTKANRLNKLAVVKLMTLYEQRWK